jgi:type II restriction/modification system DNA methylase subunit YeeA
MDTAPLKSYAPAARRAFIQAVTDRAAHYGLTAKRIEPVTVQGDVALIAGEAFPARIALLRKALEERIARDGFVVTIEAMAYTWFNRLVAIRYMELHGYLDHGLRVLSHPEGGVEPEILGAAQRIDLPGLDPQKVIDLKLDGTKQEELYRLLLVAQCNALSAAMPFLFERINDATELLLPANLLASDSVLRKLVEELPEDLWQDIEIIGWLYQFYISEKKDEVIGKVVKSEDIPAATQLFTPNWIVKYMVQNSLGATWLATYPASPLKSQMEFYIEPAEQSAEVQTQLAAITPASLDPEALTLIDPASGSGHILVEAYDLFKAIYLERGYRQRDIPELILTKNLFGLDICPRAAQLTGFALMMKGRADDRRLLEPGRGITLNVMPLVNSTDLDVERLASGVDLTAYGLAKQDLVELADLFEHATTFGSLIQVPPGLAEKLPALKQLAASQSEDLFTAESLRRLGPLVRQADVLARQYDAVVANPPYMGSKYHSPDLKKFVKEHYDGYEKDVFSAFIDRDLSLSKPHGRLGFMSPFVWMFISSHENLRTRLIELETITTLIQLEYSGFEGATVPICTFTLQKGHITGQKGCFIRLSAFRGATNQAPKTLEAIRDRNCGWFFEVAQDEFKKIPGSPIAYWISTKLLNSFAGLPPARTFLETRKGLATGDNDRFVRYWPEVKVSSACLSARTREDAKNSLARWFPFAKGGEFRRWAGNHTHFVDWENDGLTLQTTKHPVDDRIRATNFNLDYIFKEGLTWTFVTSSFNAFRFQPVGAIFSNASGYCCVLPHSSPHGLLGLFNSSACDLVLRLLNPTLNLTPGNVDTVPVPNQHVRESAEVTSRLVTISTRDWDAYERSWDFQRLPLLDAGPDASPRTLEASYAAWIAGNRQTIAEMKRLEEENNRLFIDAYGLADELTPDVPIDQITLTANPAYRYGKSLTDAEWSVEHGFGEELEARFRTDTCEELISYAIGCMMGRYSLDEPGLIYAHSGNEGFDPSRYRSFPADDDGIIPVTDFAWFDDDACTRLVQFLAVAWPAKHLDANLAFLAASLDPKKGESPRDTLRRYLAGGFYKQHLQAYKNRPIYWLFSSGKQKAFQCLVYLHRYHEGTLSRMRTQYVVPLLGKLGGRISMLADTIAKASSSSAAKKAQKEKDLLAKQQAELQAFDEQLNHYANERISLDLDDGVRVNYAKFGTLLAEVKKVSGTAGDD